MTEDEMFYEAEKAWRTISKQKINKLVDSYEKRLRMCKSVGFGSINNSMRRKDFKRNPKN